MTFSLPWPSCIARGDCGFCDIIGFADGVYKLMFSFVGIAMLVMFFLGAFTILNSRGNPEKVANGKSKMINSIIGGMIALGSWILVNTILMVLTGQYLNQKAVVMIKGVPWNQICEGINFNQSSNQSLSDEICAGKGNGSACFKEEFSDGIGICYEGKCEDKIERSGKLIENPCEFLANFGGGTYKGVVCMNPDDTRKTQCLYGKLCPGDQKCCFRKK